MSQMIEVDHLTKYYGPYTAIWDVTFDVGQGEILGFLGPNGAGKTTTMRILTGYMPPSEGTARIAGFDVFKDSLEVRRRIGYLPESVPLYPEMTVEAYLNFVAQLRGVRQGRKDRVWQVMERIRIDDRADQLIGQLSKGYRQRVGLAQAIVHDPDVLILDEPTVGLDPRQIIEVRELIRELGETHTVILSTHILPEVREVCERVVVINRGEIAAVDTLERLEANLQGNARVRLQVLRDTDLAARLRDLDGVLAVERTGEGVYEVETRQGTDRRPEIAEAVVSAGAGLLELRPVGLSLEDIFLQLTTADEPTDTDYEYDDESEEEEANA
jgi:ABC-2 type transport system ATP-binding protein